MRPVWRRARVREACVWGALVALALGLFLGLPDLDLAISAAFFDGTPGHEGFAGWDWPLVMASYHAVPWIGRCLLLVCLLMVLGRAFVPGLRKAWGLGLHRRALAVLLTLFVGVGLVVNGGFKEVWGRPRPVQVQDFGGPHPFVPAVHLSAYCDSNCSFVSGHAATGFALMSVGLLAAPSRRRRWLVIGWAAGLAVGFGRVSQGGHFASDIVFSGLVIWGCTLLLRSVWLHLRVRQHQIRVRRAAGATRESDR